MGEGKDREGEEGKGQKG